MLEDNLTKEKLLGAIGKQKFETGAQFKDYMKPKIKEMLAIPKERISEEAESDDARFSILIHDKETLYKVLIIIGLKKGEKFNDEDINNFHDTCKEKGVFYGALLSEDECHLFQYKTSESETTVLEVDEIPQLNHIDYEYGKGIDVEKIKYIALSKKWYLLGFGLFLLLMLIIAIARPIVCAKSGQVKGNINSDGKMIYYLIDSPGYDTVVIGDQKGERRFCSEQDAIDKGWVKIASVK